MRYIKQLGNWTGKTNKNMCVTPITAKSTQGRGKKKANKKGEILVLGQWSWLKDKDFEEVSVLTPKHKGM